MFNWRTNSSKTISLALQGGGSQGAYVWGVLDRLLEDERLGIEGISGTSSGAINGALVACGLAEDGREGARRRLENFWRGISRACHARRRPWFSPFWYWQKHRRDFSSKGVFFDLMARYLLPYDFNPANMNPLRQVIAESIDFEALRHSEAIKLFINATEVRTNKNRVFANGEIDVDAICASACLPFLFQAVEIGGEYYWDGAYMGNPAIYPLLYRCECSDIVLVQTSPIRISKPPDTAAEILERINEISFTSTLMREMRSIALISQLIEEGQIKRRAGLRQIRMHMIEASEPPQSLGDSSRFNADWDYICALRDLGRRAGDAWLAEKFPDVGTRSTLDIGETFM